MTIIVCTQETICPDECIYCGNWLHDPTPGGVPGPSGRYCTEDCAAAHQNDLVLYARLNHLEIRDLLCDCEICTTNGRPTAAELDEWRAYQASRQEATP